MPPKIEIVPHAAHWGMFHAVVRDGRLVEARAPANDPQPSPMLAGMPEMVHGSARIAEPMVRQSWLNGRDRNRGADRFVPVAWDEALDLVAAELRRVKADHGNESIFAGSYGWASAGRFHHAKSQLYRFMNRFGGYTGQRHSYSLAAALTILPHVLGKADAAGGPITCYRSIARRCRHMVCFGGIAMKNTQLDSGGIARHRVADELRACAEAGVKFTVISPIADDVPAVLESAGVAEWLPIRPNSDTAMMLAMLYVLSDEGLADEAFLASHCVGWPQLRAYVMGQSDGVAKSPAWAEPITRVPAACIAGLARRCVGERTMLSAAWGLQRGDHGEQPFWALVALAAAVGQIGLPGGGVGFGYGSMAGQGIRWTDFPSPGMALGSNPTGSFIPVARIVDMFEQPGREYDFDGERRVYPDARLVYWAGGNPFHHHQDLNRLAKAFRRPETVVLHEPYWTATARHADILLPTTTTLERNDICAGKRDSYWLAMHKAVEPVGAARDDYTIFAGLAKRLGFAEEFTRGRNDLAWLRVMYDGAAEQAAARGVNLPGFDEFWRSGELKLPTAAEPYDFLADFRLDPQGRPLQTPSGKIELYSERIAGFGYDDCPGHPAWLVPSEWLGDVDEASGASAYPLHLISNQPRTRLHGQNDPAGPSMAGKIRGREPIWLHPSDAAPRGIRAGEIVRVFNARGQALAGAVLTEKVMPGVVQLATGAWYDPVKPGGLDKHGNPNVLTLDKGTSKLAQGPIAHTALVQVERYRGNLPPITAFGPPQGAGPQGSES